MELRVGRHRIDLVRGDITAERVDAIVNPANAGLQLGGGVAGAVRRAGGPRIQEECDRLGGTPVGTAAITTGGELPAGRVIHAVGPRMGEGDEDRKLADAVSAALRVAREHGVESIALPAISTGIFGFPLDRCAQISLREALRHCHAGGNPRHLRFVLFDDAALRVFEEALDRLIDETRTSGS